MPNFLYKNLICLLLMCSVALYAADSQGLSLSMEESITSQNATAGAEYEYDILAESKFEDEGLFGFCSDDLLNRQCHGQPLPGTILSVILSGLLMKGLASLRRRIAKSKFSFEKAIELFLCRMVLLFQSFFDVPVFNTCCLTWQKTVLRL